MLVAPVTIANVHNATTMEIAIRRGRLDGHGLTRYSQAIVERSEVMPGIDHTKIFAHHVGGRGFGISFNCPPIFADDVIHVLYEADAQCAADMIKENNDPNRILPYCL